MKRLAFVDYATLVYLAVVGALVCVFHGGNLPRWPLYVAAHAAGMLAIVLMAWAHAAKPRNRWLETFRHFYPILIYLLLYCETGWLNQLVTTGYLDPFFYRLDQQLFGCQPSLELMARFPWLWVSEPLYAAYFSYYLMLPGIGLALYFRDRAAFHRYIATLSFVFYACYLTYILLPVAGPPIFYLDRPPTDWPPALWPATNALAYPASVQQGPFFQLVKFLYATFETPGAAFPSSHVAAAMATLCFSWRHLPEIRWFHGAAVLLLCVATVYCRFHYLVDALAGLLTAAVLIPLALAWQGTRRAGSPS